MVLFYCLEKEALGFNTSRSSRFPSARADAAGHRGERRVERGGAGLCRRLRPGAGRLCILGSVPTPRPRFLPQPPALPDGFAQPLLCRPGACFPPGKRGFGAPRCLLTSAVFSSAAGSDAVGPCPSPPRFQLHKSLNFLFLQLTEVKISESRIPDLQELPGSIRRRCQGVRRCLGCSISSGMTLPIPFSPFVPVTDRWDISPCQGCFSSGAAATWKPCRTCFSRMCCQGIPRPLP